MAEPIYDEGISWGRRLRAVVLLAVLLGGLGLMTAVITGVAVVLLGSFVDHALG